MLAREQIYIWQEEYRQGQCRFSLNRDQSGCRCCSMHVWVCVCVFILVLHKLNVCVCRSVWQTSVLQFNMIFVVTFLPSYVLYRLLFFCCLLYEAKHWQQAHRVPSLEGRQALLCMGSVTLVINEGKDLFLTWLSECMCCVCSRLQAARDEEALQSKDRTSIYSMHACVHFVCVSSLSITSTIMFFYISININLSLRGNLSKLTHVTCTLLSVCPPSISLYTRAISPINLFNVMRPRGRPKRGCDESVLLFLAKTQSHGQNINTALCCWNVTLRKIQDVHGIEP